MAELEASSNADHDMETPDEEQNQENIKCVHLFNCDKTHKLDVVEELFEVVKTKLNFAISIQSHYFALRDMSQVCENIIPDQIKVDDVAVFVVHAHESRLSINEDNAGIGYAKIYRALLRATNGKVLIVIGGDDSYKDSAEEKNSFLSRWARRKISSQFSEEYLDGRKSFIFSWNKKHRPIHEEALLHYFDHLDPDKEEKKFVLVEKKEEETVSEDPKQQVETQERTESDVEHRRTEGQSPETEPQRGQKRGEQIAPQQLPRTEEGSPEDMEIVSHPSVEDEKHKNMGDVEKTFVIVSKADFSGKPAEAASVPTVNLTEMGAVKPPLPSLPQDTEVKDTPSLATEDSLPKTEPKSVRVEEMDTSPPRESIAILFRDESDIKTIKEVFGDALLGINPVTSRDPRSMKDLLQNTPVRSCFIIVESTKIKEESRTKSSSAVYQDLLKTANGIVEKKIVVILCSEGQTLTPGEEGSITATIKELLGKKGLVFWCKENNKTERSHSPPASNLALSTHVERSINPEEFAPQKMTDNLLTERQTINSAELSVYCENKTGKERKAVRDLESRSKGALLGLSGLTSVGERVADRANAIGTEKDEDMADEEVPFVLVSPEDSWPKTQPKRTRAKGMDTSPPRERIAILIRDESDMNTIKEVFGDVLLGINPVTLNDPRSMKDLLLGKSTLVRSCFIVVESTKLLTKSSSEVYLELLKTASESVEKKIVVILCSEGKSLTYSEEESITATIKEILDEKVLVFWCKENNKIKRSSFIRSHSLPEHQKNPEELVLKTRLLRGKISYDKKDVKERVGEWTAPQEMAESLFRKWQTAESAELAVYRDLKTGNERTVVTEDLASLVKGALGRVRFTSDGANVSGWISTGANVYDTIRQYGSNLISGNPPDTEATGSNVSEDSRPEGSSNISSANSNQDLVLD